MKISFFLKSKNFSICFNWKLILSIKSIHIFLILFFDLVILLSIFSKIIFVLISLTSILLFWFVSIFWNILTNSSTYSINFCSVRTWWFKCKSFKAHCPHIFCLSLTHITFNGKEWIEHINELSDIFILLFWLNFIVFLT